MSWDKKGKRVFSHAGRVARNRLSQHIRSGENFYGFKSAPKISLFS